VRAVAAHVLRRVRHADAEARLLRIVQLDENETAQVMSVMATSLVPSYSLHTAY
jgi:hypothetical protein